MAHQPPSRVPQPPGRALYRLPAVVSTVDSHSQILKDRMASEAVWDQSAWNQETFRLPYGRDRRAAGVSVRAMNYLCASQTHRLAPTRTFSASLSLCS